MIRLAGIAKQFVQEADVGPIHIAPNRGNKAPHKYKIDAFWLGSAILDEIVYWTQSSFPEVIMTKEIWAALSTEMRNELKQMEKHGKFKLDGYIG